MTFPTNLEIEILLAHILKIDRSSLRARSNRPLTKAQFNKFQTLIQRLQKNEPIAYIVGNQPFLGLEFEVTPDVLIPRPETELMVETILKIDRYLDIQPQILDLGTGSGCIAVTLAKYLPKAKVYAIDSSKKALLVAKKNAKKNKTKKQIKFKPGNLFGPARGLKFDLIVSNPPYIPSQEIPKLDQNVRDHEPKQALDGGKDGLDVIRKIMGQAPNYLAKNGQLVLEVGFGQMKEARRLAKKSGFKKVQSYKDLAGIPRILIVS